MIQSRGVDGEDTEQGEGWFHGSVGSMQSIVFKKPAFTAEEQMLGGGSVSGTGVKNQTA